MYPQTNIFDSAFSLPFYCTKFVSFSHFIFHFFFFSYLYPLNSHTPKKTIVAKQQQQKIRERTSINYSDNLKIIKLHESKVHSKEYHKTAANQQLQFTALVTCFFRVFSSLNYSMRKCFPFLKYRFVAFIIPWRF